MVCASCGHENAQTARFCESCGATLGDEQGERRKIVSVLFCDVVGSTALGESLDAEALRALLARYFHRMQAVIEQHGGTVEKFIGDAVMAVFGVPAVHEDDALRACRAAVDMRDAFPELGIEGRIGVSTGEVVTGTRERLATGDALNIAARLQQAAAPGEVLIAETTRMLVGDAIEVAYVEPLSLKGKREPVTAFRLIGAKGALERRHDAPFVGREAELSAVAGAWKRVNARQACQMITVVGDAGLGKSRFVSEAVALLDARVVRGRCLPYGTGITYWPVVEVVKQLGVMPADPAAAAALRSLLESDARASAEEIDWAFRRLLADQAPLVVVFDDLQWGEETLLDLVEQLPDRLGGNAILAVCMARPDLLERRPDWPASLLLEPLGDQDVADLIGTSMPEPMRRRIMAAANGNPLFVSEMLAMAVDSGADTAVPPTLRALLDARLELLDPADRRVLEQGAVEGEVFHRGAVQALAPDSLDVGPQLTALAQRQLIHPVPSMFAGDAAYRFHHLLMRDTAYEGVSKAARADMHQRFAAWVESRGDRIVELDEIVGYHLEQSARYASDLGRSDPALAARAGERLAAAGRRAYWRGDDRAAVGLLERALELVRPARLDVVLELDLAAALFFQDGGRSTAVADAAAERARAAGDATGELLARVGAGYNHLMFDENPDTDELERLARDAVARLEQEHNHAGLVHVWYALGFGIANLYCRFEDHAHASEQAIVNARLAGQDTPRLFYLEDALAQGPRPADAALQTLDTFIPDNPHPATLVKRAWLLTMLGRHAEASSITDAVTSRYRELTGDDTADVYLGYIASAAGRHDDAAVHLRRWCDLLEARGLRGYLSTFAPLLGRSLCALGRHDEAEPLAQLGREIGDERDAMTQAIWRQVTALIDANRGQFDHAEQLAREAIAITETTDSLNMQADALCDLASVLQARGEIEQSQAVLTQAVERYERKHNVSMAAQARDQLRALEHARGR